MPFYNGSLVRSLNLQGDELSESLRIHQESAVIQYPAYTSFSTKRGYGLDDTVRIYLKESEHGRDLRRWNPNGQEVVYERDAVFEVLGITIYDGIYRIFVREGI